MMRCLLQRPGKPQDLVCALTGRGLNGNETRTADGQGSRLVEHYGMGSRQRFERPATFDEDAAPCRLRYAGDEGDRRREDQRTRRGGDQYRQSPDRVAGEKPGGTGHDKGDRQQQKRIAIGQTNERRLRRLRCRDHADDAGIRAFSGGGCGPELECLTRVERAATRRLSFTAIDRKGLAGKSRIHRSWQPDLRSHRQPG